MAKNKGPKQQPSFFKQQQEKYGPDFINRINTDIIRKNALKIFRDLSYGAINTVTDYVYFNVYDFTYNLYVSANDNAMYNWCCYHGLSMSPVAQQDENMQKIAKSHYDHYMIYMSISAHLNNILQNITYYNGIYTKYYLDQMIAELRWSRNVFNGYFITIGRDDDKRRNRQERRQIPYDQGVDYQSEGGFFG